MKILLVDDEAEFCIQAQQFLQSEGHEVYVETNGDYALNRVAELLPDVVILDVDLGLSGVDGRAICARIAQSSEYREGRLGVLMISGHYIAPNDEVIGIELGADNYLVKPFELAQLSARVKAISRRVQANLPESIAIDEDLIIHFNRREVICAGEPCPLSRLEFNVLAYLARSPGMARTKAELLENVWSSPHVEEGSIAKCMSVLRRKLSPMEPERYIQTIYGVGYKLISMPTESHRHAD